MQNENVISFNVYAVVVTFNPNLIRLQQLLKSIMPQVSKVIIVDNNSKDNVVSQDKFNCCVISCEENFGIAYAQNIGIKKALKEGAQYILLLDQDSIPADNMVSKLVESLRLLGSKVAAVGPDYVDEKNMNAPSLALKNQSPIKIINEIDSSLYVECDYLISSGMLINSSVFDIVGYKKEELFIDYVDTEWCLRARGLGYLFYSTLPAKMLHSIGEHVIEKFGKKINIHSPIRYYYIYRNYIYLCTLNYIPFKWKYVDFIKLCKLGIFTIIFSSNRSTLIKYIFNGINDGIKRRMGAAHIKG